VCLGPQWRSTAPARPTTMMTIRDHDDDDDDDDDGVDAIP
jgi:hypothetical protein